MSMKRFLSGLSVAVLLATGAVHAASVEGQKDLRVANAAMADDLDAVKAALKQKADVNAAQGDGMTALHWAAFKDDADMVKLLLASGANVRATTRIGDLTPLLVAAKNGNPAVIGALLKAGADVNMVSSDGMSPLMATAVSGNAESVKILIDAKAAVNLRERAHGQTALMFAAAEGRDQVITALLKGGADWKLSTNVVKVEMERYDDNGNPLPQRGDSTVTGGNTQMGGMTALLFAAREGHLAAVKALVEGGADINQLCEGDKSTPLIIAIANGHYAVGKYLTDKGANPNLANVDGLTPLYAAINMQYAALSWAPVPVVAQEKVSHLELMKALLEHGADPNAKLKRKLWFSPSSHDQQWINPVGATAFWRAAQGTDYQAMKLLVEHGADPKLTTNAKTDALMVAAGLGYAGNFSQTKDDEWLDAVKYCVETLHMDPNATDSQGYTAIMGAAWRGNNDVIKYLFDHGAKLDAHNRRGWSVTDMANGPALRSSVPMTHPETIAYLIKLGAPELTKVEGEAILGSNRKVPVKPATDDKKPESKPEQKK